MNESDRQYERQWHLDKKVPIALMFMLAMQGGAFVWWAAFISARTEALEHITAPIGLQAERIVRLETKMDAIKDTLLEIKNLVRK